MTLARRHRVMIVDDSAILRRLLVEALASEPAIEVVGAAVNGRQALEVFDALAPDLVTLDVEMPELDGLATLREIRKRSPSVPVVMFSSSCSKGAQSAFAALLAGASDFVNKPAGGASQDARAEIRAHLAPKIVALCENAARLPRTSFLSKSQVPSQAGQDAAGNEALAPAPRVVAIAVSTGGPAALAKLLPALGSDLRVPIVIVQHMPQLYTRQLAESLAKKCAIDVREAQAGDLLIDGRCLIAPGDQHMSVEPCAGGARIALGQTPPENSCRPSADVLFRSVASVFKARSLALVMTGMGQDGLVGARAIHAAGGAILAQDQASSVVWGMPSFVVRERLAERVLDVDGLAREVRRRALGSGNILPVERASADRDGAAS